MSELYQEVAEVIRLAHDANVSDAAIGMRIRNTISVWEGVPQSPWVSELLEAIEDLQHFSDHQLDRNPKMQKTIATVIAALSPTGEAGR